MDRLWVIAPSYRDVPSFLVLRQRILDVVARTPPLARTELRFVLIDDTAGHDAEVDKLRGFPDTSVVQPPFNLGHQRALVYALRVLGPRLADDDLVVTLDADGQDRPEDLPGLLDAVIPSDLRDGTVVLARRTTRAESFVFKVWYLAFRIVFRCLTGIVIRSGNFAAYKGAVVKRLLQHPSFDLCYSSTFVSLDAPIIYVPCPRGPRYAGRSHMNRSKLILHGIRMLMPFLDRVAIRTLLFVSTMLGVSILALLAIALTALVGVANSPNWLTYSTFGVFGFSVISATSCLVLFATFSQSRGLSLSTLEHGHAEWNDSSPPIARRYSLGDS